MSKFAFGDVVRVKESAAMEVRRGQIGAIVSIERSESSTSYTVEFGDGSDCEMVESLLEAADDRTGTSPPKAIK